MTSLAVSPSAARPLSPLGTASLLLVPIALVNAVGFLWPVINLLKMSFREASASGALGAGYSVETWRAALTDHFTLELIANSVGVSLLITVLTLIASYPIALYLHRSTGTWRTVLMVLVVAPLLTSAVVRTYGWIAILSDRGLVANALMMLGMTDPPRLMFNLTGVIIGLTEILMPYMILALLSGFGRLDPRFEEAALTLGARPLKIFVRVVLPLTAPGMALGSLLCFVLAISSFVTPKLLGGGRVFLLATEIYDQAIVTLNWPLAAALSMIVLVVFGVSLTLYGRALRHIA